VVAFSYKEWKLQDTEEAQSTHPEGVEIQDPNGQLD
jgi:hypothetical protein